MINLSEKGDAQPHLKQFVVKSFRKWKGLEYIHTYIYLYLYMMWILVIGQWTGREIQGPGGDSLSSRKDLWASPSPAPAKLSRA